MTIKDDLDTIIANQAAILTAVQGISVGTPDAAALTAIQTGITNIEAQFTATTATPPAA